MSSERATRAQHATCAHARNMCTCTQVAKITDILDA